jgi:anti-sigma factor RsiW
MEPRDPLSPDDSCGLILQDSFEYHDESDPLPDARRRVIRRHLDGCPSCAAHYRTAAALQAALPLWEAPRATPGFVDRVVAAAHRDRSSREGLVGWVRSLASRRIAVPLPLAAAAALAVIAALLLSQRLSRDPGLRDRTPHDGPVLAYAAEVAAPAALTILSGPDPALVQRVLRSPASDR